MAKVIFEFDECDDRQDINLIVNRHKLINALYELSDYQRTLAKCCEEKAIVIDNGKVIGSLNNLPDNYDGTGKLYVEDEVIINKIDSILHNIRNIINEY